MNVWLLDSPLKPSRWQQGLVAVFHLLALLAVMVACIPVWSQAVLLVALVLMAVFSARRLRRISPDTVVALYADAEHWFVTLGNGQRLRVMPFMWGVWRYLVVLDVKSTGLDIPYRLLIFPDSINAASYRRLQARLRLASSPSSCLRLLDGDL